MKKISTSKQFSKTVLSTNLQKDPKSPSNITTEWLNSMLTSEIPNNEIISIEIDKNFGPWSLLGKVIKINLKYANEQQLPKSIIVKFQVHNSEPEKEGDIYRLLSETKASHAPLLYERFANGGLILEDMSPTHSVLETDFTIDQIKSVISVLAEVNSSFWNDSRIPKDDLRHFINSININMGESWDIFKDRYQEQLGEEIAAFEWMWVNSEIISRHYNSGPTTLSHGDLNKSNILFANDASGKPVLIDWQLSGHKVLPFDLSYFIVKNLTVEQRRRHEDALLKQYYELLPRQIQNSYPFERFFLNYRACLTRSMLSAVTIAGPKFNSHPNHFKISDERATRIIEAMRDLKPIEALRELEENK